MNNLISIVLPCYKAEKYIRNIIGDIENQSYSNWELIIVSNGDSQENQVKIINEFCQKDNRIRLISTVLGGGEFCTKYRTSELKRRLDYIY